MSKVEIQKTLAFIKKLPENRRFFYNTGLLLIEISKEEAVQILEEKLRAVGETQPPIKKDNL